MHHLSRKQQLLKLESVPSYLNFALINDLKNYLIKYAFRLQFWYCLDDVKGWSGFLQWRYYKLSKPEALSWANLTLIQAHIDQNEYMITQDHNDWRIQYSSYLQILTSSL